MDLADDALIEVKSGVDALRTVRTSLLQVAYCVAEKAWLHGYLVLVNSSITKDRLLNEWERAASVLRQDLLKRLSICLVSGQDITGIPHAPEARTLRAISDAVQSQRGRSTTSRVDYSFVVKKILLHQWLTCREPVTSEWLARTAGCSYPAVARTLNSLGGLLERRSDRRVSFRWFPREEFARMMAISGQARCTTRFADHSGKPRPLESHLRRLEKLNLTGLAIGGVLGARHLFPDLDLVGTPRLDLSLHSPGRRMDLRFIETLDPALKRVADPLAPANVVVHAVNHADPLFTPREGGLAWADALECLFDLHENRLDAQASQLLAHLEKSGKTKRVESK